ncbi:MAG TPA: hypothetical protein QGF58_25075 [Myxococcota bacterium]|nr:hypothetical protein [Myxococcota bacterium]
MLTWLIANGFLVSPRGPSKRHLGRVRRLMAKFTPAAVLDDMGFPHSPGVIRAFERVPAVSVSSTFALDLKSLLARDPQRTLAALGNIQRINSGVIGALMVQRELGLQLRQRFLEEISRQTTFDRRPRKLHQVLTALEACGVERQELVSVKGLHRSVCKALRRYQSQGPAKPIEFAAVPLPGEPGLIEFLPDSKATWELGRELGICIGRATWTNRLKEGAYLAYRLAWPEPAAIVLRRTQGDGGPNEAPQHGIELAEFRAENNRPPSLGCFRVLREWLEAVWAEPNWGRFSEEIGDWEEL